MTRSEFEHVLRAAAAISQEQSFVVVGSQAVLLSFPDAPAELLVRIGQLDSGRYPVTNIADWARRRAMETHP